MKTKRRYFLLSLFIPLFFVICLINVQATPGIDVVSATPVVDIKINYGTTDSTKSATFLSDLKAALIAKGIDSSKLTNVSLTTAQSVSVSDSSAWVRYDHVGDWTERAYAYISSYVDSNNVSHSYTSNDHFYNPNQNPGNDGDMTNDPHIITSSDGSTIYFYGYGQPAYQDFLLSVADSSNDKEIHFRMDESAVSYHTLYGAGYIFNAKVENNLLYGYTILVGSDRYYLLKINGSNIDNLHDGFNTALTNVSTVDTFIKDSSIVVHNFVLKLTKDTSGATPIDVMTFTDNNNALVSRTSASVTTNNYALPTVFGNRFGPFVRYNSHGCSILTAVVFDNLDMSMTQSQTQTLEEIAAGQTYANDSKKYFISFENNTLDSNLVDDLDETFINQGANYIGVGSSTSLAQHNGIKDAAGSGYTIDITDSDLVQKIADYIYNLVLTQTITNINTTYPNAFSKNVSSDDVEADATGLDTAINPISDYLDGNNVRLELELTMLTLNNITSTELDQIQTYVSSLTNPDKRGKFVLDINLTKILTDSSSNTTTSAVTQTLNPISFTIVIPESERGYYDYQIFRIHNDVLETIPSTYDAENHTLTFSSSYFSTYGVTYSSVPVESTSITSAPAPESSTNRAPKGKNYVFDTPKVGNYSDYITGTDPDGDAVWYQLLGSGPASGHLEFLTDGTFTYIPDSTTQGEVFFSYQVCDSWKCSPAYTVKLTNKGGIPATGVEDNFNLMWTGMSLILGASLIRLGLKLKIN